jgi:hypothetical protein
VTAETEGAIHGDLTWLEGECLKNFGNHNWSVATGGGFAGCQHFSHVVAIALGVELFVFIFEASRIFPGIARAPLMRSSWLGRRN